MGYREIVNRWINVEPSENAERILKQRYYWRDREENYLETKWEDVSRRVSRVVASGELRNPSIQDKSDAEKLEFIKNWEEAFYEMLKSRIFIPNSPTLFNAGLGVDYSLLWKPIEQMSLKDYETIFKSRNHLHMLSACFVVPVEDSIEGIFEAVKEYALITKAGGGVGSNFSELRPKGSNVAGTSGRASGPVSFMHVFNTAINVVEQGYKRRGALMGILDITHPDIEEFIIAKRDNDGNAVLKYFNISVGIWDKDKVLELFHNGGELELTHPRSEIKRRIRVRDLFYKIAESAWKSGDPGLAFLGEMNRYYALYPNKKIVSTNPCGEIGLSDYEACNLGSIDVMKFVREDGTLDEEALAETAKKAVRFLDDVIEVNVFPLKKIDESVRGSRRLGLGIMGFADTLYMMNVPYNSPEARQFAADLMAFIALNAYESSALLAEEKGNFPLFHLSRWNDSEFVPFAMGLSRYDDDLKDLFRRTLGKKRNVALLTIAPTGSISNIADTSSGLEPNFLLAYTRYVNRSDGTREPLVYVNKILMNRLGDLLDEDMKQRIIEEGSLRNIREIPEDIRKVFVVSHDIAPMDHLLMQDAFQRYVDNNISKTINMPNSATVEDVLNIYLEAMKLNVRGLTVYRDGSLETQVLTSVKKLKTKDAPKVQFFVLDEKHKLRARPRKESLRSVTRKYKREDGTTYITVSFDDNGEAIEIFVSNGSEASEIIGRLSSIALRAGVSLEEILEQLRKVRGDYAKGIAEEIKKAVDDFIELWGPQEEAEMELIHIDGTRKTEEEIEKFVRANDLKWVNGYYVDAEGNTYCPVCLSKNSLVNQEGCMSCMNCAWSKCTVG
ncbi:MAG: ribonucleoside-diphosphate reductase alpha chain [Thermotogota bacterium]|nr:ribonucleoside-diphosphate reductase alpha chain [Thermotogota bacterium]MDK2863844.1 ribonucleoside-diphosphate reductase alpha chain [Thermotogota bacterium]HCZ05970.1 adenosylcobalamin-dependent ribonucleoside-diphosphate reductase [Thermotogota bacterium]